LRILLLAADSASAAAFSRALVARGHDVDSSLPAAAAAGAPAPPPGADVVVADVRTAPAGARAARGAAALVLLVRPGGAVDAAWARTGPDDVLEAADDGAPAGAPGAVDALLASARDRAASRERALRALVAVESSRSPFLLVTAAGLVEHANPAGLSLLGAAGGAPRSVRDLFPAGADDPATAPFLSAVASGAEWSGEVRVAAPGGGPVLFEATVSPVRRPPGPAGDVPAGVVVTLSDLTRRHAEEAALRDANRLLAERASTDPLCGLYNRAYLQQALDREVARWRRYGQPFAVLMIDLDDFKRVNDLFGHEVGDDVLRAVAGGLRGGLREGDVLARYGGDEFCALLPSTPLEAAWPVAERLRERVAGVRAGLSTPTRIAASIGIATTEDLRPEADGADLLRLADRSMLAAKRLGGDRCLHGLGAAPAPAPTPAPPTPGAPVAEPTTVTVAASASVTVPPVVAP
jgi:diguanylate cyclase (GGDEF)-like protein